MYEMHIFKYSVRKGTRAAVMKGQLTEAAKTKRSAVLLDMEAVKSKEYRSQFIGKTMAVLFEEEKEILGRKYMVGHTREYVKVAVPTVENTAKEEAMIANRIIEVTVQNFLTDDVLAAK